MNAANDLEFLLHWPADRKELMLLGLAELRSRIKKDHPLAKSMDAWIDSFQKPVPVPVLLEKNSRPTSLAQIVRPKTPPPTLFPKADWEAFARAVDDFESRAYLRMQEWNSFEVMPTSIDGPCDLPHSDAALLEKVFEEILPKQFAAEQEGKSFESFRRPAQKDMAVRVAQALGSEHFLLLNAPTGTGKTLAYLVPALLCAARWQIRIGVSTYTRALQEQAYSRELPRALLALQEAGLTTELRATLLKGRQNYLCWKRLRHALPGPEESADDFLAWFLLLQFAANDAELDLDRFSPELPLALQERKKLAEALDKFRRLAQATRNCCSQKQERKHCGADLARRRAERSHLVITNHAFVFAAPEFFRQIVFDESEHLHAQALSTETVDFRPYLLQRNLNDLCEERADSKAPLDVLRTRGQLLAAEWGPRAPKVYEAWKIVRDRFEDLQNSLSELESWRKSQNGKRDFKESHALFQEYANDPNSQTLRESASALLESGVELGKELEQLLEDLAQAPLRGAARLRAQILRSKEELEENLEKISRVLPLTEGRFQFDPEFFYDLEIDYQRRADPSLTRRILLPDVWLSKHFWNTLQSAALLSATACLQGGFETSAAYLGLPEENRDTFSAPDPFDYSRVLFAVPTDAPRFEHSKTGRENFLNYVTKFLRELCLQVRGNCLVLFTSADDLRQTAERLIPEFSQNNLPLWYQGMDGVPKEQLANRFRDNPGSTLLGLDTFWYGIDLPGGICEYVVIVKLPYGQLDRYHFAQRAALGEIEQRQRIYMPRALGMFRQGFGRLLRRKEDRGAVFLLDRRVLEPYNRGFLKELPGLNREEGDSEQQLKTCFAPTKRCLAETFQHMNLNLGTSYVPSSE